MTIGQLQHIANLLVRAYREEIIRDGDWWFGIDQHDFNIHNYGREDSDIYSVNVYEQNGEGLNEYSHCINLAPIRIVSKETHKYFDDWDGATEPSPIRITERIEK